MILIPRIQGMKGTIAPMDGSKQRPPAVPGNDMREALGDDTTTSAQLPTGQENQGRSKGTEPRGSVPDFWGVEGDHFFRSGRPMESRKVTVMV